MVVLVYRPEHPNANENGIVTRDEALEWDYMQDNRAVIDNKLVTMNIISDSMPATRNMCDGKMYESKAAFRGTTKAHGCIEVGNDTGGLKRTPVILSRKDRREAIKKSIYDLKNGKAQQ